MTKQEKIQEAYGEYWDLFTKEEQNKILIDNGWNSYFNHPLHWEMSKFIEIETIAYGVGTSWRPLSLQGIENNNGWIKIESEVDLPDDDDELLYEICHFEDEMFKRFYEVFNWQAITKIWEGNSEYFQDEITHYRPIVKPKPPIY